jgi:hypothetical protein
MDINGNTLDNLHIGDVRITGNLQVDGEIKVDSLNVESLTIGDPEYTLPTSAGTDGQVITMNADGKTTDFKDLTAGSARVVVNKYSANLTNIRNESENSVYRDIDDSGFGSKVYTLDEWTEGSVITIRASGNWSYLRSSQAFIPEGKFRVIFGASATELCDVFPEKAFAGTFPQTVSNNGNWQLTVTLTRTSPTAYRVGGTFTNSLSDQQNQIEIPIIKPQQLNLLPNIIAIPPVFPATLNIQWYDSSPQGGGTAWIYPAICNYTQDLVNAGTSILATSETLTTDHTLLSNLTLGDAGHTQFALLNGRTLGQTLSGGVLPAESLKLKSHTAGTDNIDIKDTKTEFKKNIDMDSNNIINANQITKTTPSGANLEIKHNDGPVVISGQGLLSKYQDKVY